MNARWWQGLALLGLMALTPAAAGARGLDVEVWTDRGDDAVYQPGDQLEVRVRASQDAYLMVYEIDSEGYVRLLYPYRGGTGFVEGRRTYTVPPERSNVELVVDRATTGECYVVAIAARDRFREFPWYLRPYDMQAEEVGYQGMHDDEEGITAEGRIVGDPFVAMEKVRRRVVDNADDPDAFGTGYATYYVHEKVRYPRYLCYDCHRPGRWAWWSDFDPYYTHCSVFDFRVNWGWGWGPSYWFGYVPYYYYVPRYDCPPRYRPYYQNHNWFSSWDGWRRWNSMWGDHLIRYKTNPPPGYVPPSRYPDRGKWGKGTSAPPGFIVSDVPKGREGFRERMTIGRGGRDTRPENQPRDEGVSGRRPGRGREVSPGDGGRGASPGEETRGRGATPQPRGEWSPREERPREPSPRDQPREEKPRSEPPRDQKPREETSRGKDRRSEPAPADKPRDSRGSDAKRGSDGRDSGHGGSRYKG